MRTSTERAVQMSLKLLYRNPRQPSEAGMKLVPDQSHSATEKKILEGLGFTVIEVTSGTSLRRHAWIHEGPG
jgi:hypothetical protein